MKSVIWKREVYLNSQQKFNIYNSSLRAPMTDKAMQEQTYFHNYTKQQRINNPT